MSVWRHWSWGHDVRSASPEFSAPRRFCESAGQGDWSPSSSSWQRFVAHFRTSGPPVASQEVTGKRYQLLYKPDPPKSTSPGEKHSLFPSRRCSKGDIFKQSKVRQISPPLTPRQRRVSLENASVPVVTERRSTLGRLLENTEDRSSGELTTATLCQTETTSQFASFTGGGESGVTCHKQETSDFSPNILVATSQPALLQRYSLPWMTL